MQWPRSRSTPWLAGRQVGRSEAVAWQLLLLCGPRRPVGRWQDYVPFATPSARVTVMPRGQGRPALAASAAMTSAQTASGFSLIQAGAK